MTSISTLNPTELTVSGIAGMVAGGEVTPTEVVEAYLERIAALEPTLQAFSYLDVEGVRATAAVLTEEAAAGKLRGPLHGVPVAIKDEFHIAGTPTFFADPSGTPQTITATAVKKLREAGALIIGKTHMPVGGKNPPTRNPWNPAHTAGGSSSGSGAAVGARMAPVALGEQTGGSNLRPAGYCGVEGLKPSFGRISRYGMYPFSYSHDHAGVIGLTMEDIALVFSVIAGPDPLDHTSLMEPLPPADLDVASIAPPRIGVVRNFFPERTQPVMQAAIEKSAATLKAAGATVVDVLLPEDFGLLWTIRSLVSGPEALTLHSRRLLESGEQAPLRERVAELVPATYYLQTQRLRHRFWLNLQALFTDVDALLMGVAPGPAPEGLETTGDASLLSPWTWLGYPASTVNGGLSPEGLPLGLQLVAAPLAEYTLMRASLWCEQTLGRLPAPSTEY